MAKTAKKSSKAKVKSKTASAKTAAKKSVSQKVETKAAKIDRSVTLQKIYKFNLFSAVAYLAFAVLSVIFVSKESVNMVLTHATKDELASTSGSVLGPAYRTIATVEVRYLLAVIFVISAIFALLLATRLRKSYEDGVKSSVSGLRWVFMGITLALTLEVASILGGVEDIMTLKLIAGLILTTTILAWMAERANKGSKKQYAAFGLSLFTGVIAWLPLIGSLVGTTLYGIESFGWYVYALSGFLLVGFISIALSQYKHVRNGVSAKGYLQLEGKYLSADFIIKLGLFGIILTALYK